MDINKTSEKIKGTAKEVAGQITGDDDLEREGQARQEKVRDAEEAEAKEAEAAQARKQAEGHAGEQKARED